MEHNRRLRVRLQQIRQQHLFSQSFRCESEDGVHAAGLVTGGNNYASSNNKHKTNTKQTQNKHKTQKMGDKPSTTLQQCQESAAMPTEQIPVAQKAQIKTKKA